MAYIPRHLSERGHTARLTLDIYSVGRSAPNSCTQKSSPGTILTFFPRTASDLFPSFLVTSITCPCSVSKAKVNVHSACS